MMMHYSFQEIIKAEQEYRELKLAKDHGQKHEKKEWFLPIRVLIQKVVSG